MAGKTGREYGYKICYAKSGWKDVYRPIYCCTDERWRIGEWTTASDKECSAYSSKKVKEIFAHLFKGTKKRFVRLISSSGYGSNNHHYEPGYHYFDTLEQVVGAWDEFGSNYDGKKRILYCEFRERVAIGNQWGHECRVAKKMMPMEEITIAEARRAL
jgi:hypothetical protein